jgi:4-hydroxybenzoyl-CoA thioesterase/acyl-CoA thioester hydrolase
VLDIEVRVLRKGRSSVTYGFEFSIEGRSVASGRIAAACCLLDLPEGLKAVPIPEEIAARIEVEPE